MIKKFICKLTKIFIPARQEEKDVCEHANRVSKTVKYCMDCKLVLDES
mgnify:CR=1 FL=1|jgi:Skp family chaperone for outer membrane proteins